MVAELLKEKPHTWSTGNPYAYFRLILNGKTPERATGSDLTLPFLGTLQCLREPAVIFGRTTIFTAAQTRK
ncbi:hypothetical protein KL921_004777 [Ogataea angusta]|uniref:Uncharacterized protein n=1 Tax=Pichia angusta TaxID=870730 RepID=A0AAN6DAN5_PICAN|nr:uncharacterized protein KL928_005283 [Ogataea angusta]KAG7806380.1 hypothetical protein KL921_004777 [Ogataea angusta]KAG7815944.1 hypothetical protein KL928_005283 [Ogataea angusta]KAG7853840.1 hypothetical protein KL939_005335 [Ogataea angusta]